MTSTLGSRSVARNGRALSPAFLERQWKPGQSGNPKGHTAEYGEVVALAQAFSVRAIERLGELMESTDERVAVVAANAILDRAFGKPQPQRHEPPTPLEQRLRQMTPDQREQEAREFYRKVQQRLLEAEAAERAEAGGIGYTIDQEPEKPATSISRERRWK
jgi:hypothetical protein